MDDDSARILRDQRFASFFFWRVLLIFLLGAFIFALWRLTGFLLLLFGAALIAVGLRAATSLVSRRIGIGNAAALTFVVMLIFVVSGLVFWLFGSIIGTQLDDLRKQVPTGLGLFAQLIQTNNIARYALEQARSMDVADLTGRVAVLLAALIGKLASAAGYAVVMLLLAVYIAAQPDKYRKMVLRLIPAAYSHRVGDVLSRSGDIMRRWLLGQLIVMACIGLLCGLGLWALGIDAPVALGLISGLMSFIPYVGAALSAVPAILVALNLDPIHALWVLLLYIGVHAIEGDVITPLIQAEATELSPVVSLSSIIVAGILFGPAAVLIAAPLTLFLSVVVEVVYVEAILGNGDAP